MDRRSTISGSSSLSSHTRDEFRDLTTYYRNYFAGSKGESQDAAMEKSNIYVKALKMLGFGFQQLINWVKKKDADPKSATDKDFSGNNAQVIPNWELTYTISDLKTIVETNDYKGFAVLGTTAYID